MDIELRHLRMVCAIADAGSVTRAAATLGLAQPALTTALQRIERALGGTLFERDRRGARPTPLGELVLARARLLIPAVKGLQDDAAHLAGTGDALHRYRIGATNGPIAGGLVQRLSATYPRKQVSVHATWSGDDIAAMVLDGRLEYALVGQCADQPMPSEDLVWRTVCVDPVWVLMSGSHPSADRDEVSLSELAGEQWANAPGDGCFIDCFAAACARAGFTPRAVLEMDVGSCVDLVISGAAVVLSQATARDMAGTVNVPLAGSPLGWRHVLGWNPASATAAAADEVHRLAGEAYQAVADQRPRYAAWLHDHAGFGVLADDAQ
jgi:DNA-binding transcriptional LysR family regulator